MQVVDTFLRVALFGGGGLAATAGMALAAMAAIASGPMVVPRMTLEQPGRTIVLQGMSHVGDAAFFDAIADEIRMVTARGGCYLYEGIGRQEEGAGSLTEHLPELQRRWVLAFIDQIDDLRAVLTDGTGLVAQPQPRFVDAAGGRSLNADIAFKDLIDHLLARYPGDEKAAEVVARARSRPTRPDSASSGLGAVDGASDEARRRRGLVTRNLARYLLNLAQHWLVRKVESRSGRDRYAEAFGDDFLIGHLNAVARQAIASRSEAIIYVTYGAAHVEGLAKMLQRDGWRPTGRETRVAWN